MRTFRPERTRLFTAALAAACTVGLDASRPAARPAADGKALAAEQAIAATVSESRMVQTVRHLVGFGARMYGTPSNHESAAWLADAFRQAGLEVTVRKDPARDWFQPGRWEVKAVAAAGAGPTVLASAWPAIGSPSATGEAELAIDAGPGAVCLTSKKLAPQSTGGCVAVLFDGRTSPSGYPGVARLRGTWTIPVFSVSPRESEPLRARVAAGGKARVSFTLEARRGRDAADTVVATLPGKDRSRYILFCAHGDSDSGGPGADDNASGVAAVLEIARAAAAAVKAGLMEQPAWDLRFAAWGGEMTSTREYVASMAADPSRLQAVINFDQAGFAAGRDALYVEPDDVPVNREIVTVVRAVMRDHLGAAGFPSHAASVKSQGGTDSYVFQDTRGPGAAPYPAVTLYTSAWDEPQAVKVTDGFPPIGWFDDEKPGMVTVSGDPVYHSTGDTPARTTDTKPFDMGWCARVALLSARRLMGQ